MRIENLFQKAIGRSINGVVKADQLDERSIWQELEEFVVTRELDKHLRTFFRALLRDDRERERRRHLRQDWGVDLRILRVRQVAFHQGLVLSARQRAAQLRRANQESGRVLREQNQGRDALWRHQASGRSNTDVILFNIDSKADAGAGRDAILAVFLKVLNEMQGYSGDHPHIAHMERYLDGKGKLNEFHGAYREGRQVGLDRRAGRLRVQPRSSRRSAGADPRPEPGVVREVDRRRREQLSAHRGKLCEVGQGVPGLARDRITGSIFLVGRGRAVHRPATRT